MLLRRVGIPPPTGWVRMSRNHVFRNGPKQCLRIRILCFFQISKKHDFLRFFEMMYQKVVKSR